MILKLEEEKRKLQEENLMLSHLSKRKLERLQAMLAQRGKELAAVQGAAKAAVVELNTQKAALQVEKAKQAKTMSLLLRCGDASPAAHEGGGGSGVEELREQLTQALSRLPPSLYPSFHPSPPSPRHIPQLPPLLPTVLCLCLCLSLRLSPSPSLSPPSHPSP